MTTQTADLLEVLLGDDGLLSSEAVCQLTGLSYRQLDYWCRSGVIEATVPARGSGSTRRWSPDVVEFLIDRQARIEACPLHPHGGNRGNRNRLSV